MAYLMTIKKVMKYEHDYQHAIYRCLLGKNIVFCTEKRKCRGYKSLKHGRCKNRHIYDGVKGWNTFF